MDLLLRIFETLAIAIGVPLGLYLLGRLFPFKPDALPKQRLSFDVLRSKYAKWEAAGLIPFFAFSGLGGYLIFRGLIWVFHHSLPQNEENRYLMLPDQYFFMLPAIFVGILLGAVPTDLLYRLLLKEKYAEYTLYGNLKAGFDGWKVVKFLSALILIPSVIFTVLAMDCYARFTDDQIITNRYWGLGEIAHNYNQIARIKSVRFIEAPSGKVVENPYHVVHFNDGSIWSTRNTFYRADQELKLSAEKEKESLAFVAEKCGKEIERYDFLNGKED
jgi:hypothetical protein